MGNSLSAIVHEQRFTLEDVANIILLLLLFYFLRTHLSGKDCLREILAVAVFIVFAKLISDRLRFDESFNERFGCGSCDPYMTAMDRCFQENSGPTYGDEVTDMCHKKVKSKMVENFSEKFEEKFGTDNDNEDENKVKNPYTLRKGLSGIDSGILSLLNKDNPNMKGFDGKSYLYNPQSIMNEHHEVGGFDKDKTRLMGQPLEMANMKIEHLKEKEEDRDYAYSFGNPNSPQVVLSGPNGTQSA